MLEVVDVLGAEGIAVVQAVVLVDRSGGEVAAAFAGRGIPYRALLLPADLGVGAMIVRVSRSPLRLLGYALVAVPMILLAVDMLVAYRFFPFPETTTASAQVSNADGSTTEVTYQVYTDNGKAQRRRDLAWGSAFGLGGLVRPRLGLRRPGGPPPPARRRRRRA